MRLLERIAHLSPEFGRLRSRLTELEENLRQSEVEVSSLRDLQLHLTDELTALRKDLEASHAREREVYEKWIDSTTNRGIFGHSPSPGPDSSEPVKLPPGKLIGIVEAKRKNRQTLNQMLRGK